MQNESINKLENISFKQRGFSYVYVMPSALFLVLSVFLFAVLLVKHPVNNDTSIIPAVPFAFSALFVVFMRLHKIEIANGFFIYRNGFCILQKIPLDKIKSAELLWKKKFHNRESLIFEVQSNDKTIEIAAHNFVSYAEIEKILLSKIINNGFGKDFFEKLEHTMRKKNDDIGNRFAAASSIAMFENEAAENVLIDIITDEKDDPAMRTECCIHLAEIWKKKDIFRNDIFEKIPSEYKELVLRNTYKDICDIVQ